MVFPKTSATTLIFFTIAATYVLSLSLHLKDQIKHPHKHISIPCLLKNFSTYISNTHALLLHLLPF
ncbi:hypothetical protein HanRHA438_Chr06g0266231 [Helianthus annuus]|uniref:Uncharacterized protein n=1 Tax=Helianthus annuus TaxID=4232 RepID=A0A251VHY7_HELAN|nr:hypothetical protein HanXRQr2_Chr06g0257051 [Helianthus annuus]KAJ0573408.1 hypothetical protein HanHA89_Chr06g0226401 [Helianthus annuus]KAJ0740672.1 hypothetical protein HanOQP8_Chr06g0219381 [Helianthus annuus]KAJ0911717.1 hypothetical protein HanRHA438_Chr06g0266231 [Helianthus annuus]KAJ0915279.1 hypothetical protein HanPSC8_Chr06g0248071 [Helianthus annuus]